MDLKKICFWALPFFLLHGCFTKEEKKTNADIKSEMMAAEVSFSTLSQERGARKAFLEFIDSNGVLLRPNYFPLVSGNAVNFISKENDTSYIMTWQTKGANVAASGDLGYTYGIYTISPKNKDTVIYGTYVNIWKKQQSGAWKLLLDSGNEGIDNGEE